MATTIGALAYNISVDTKQLKDGFDLTRKEITAANRVLRDIQTPADMASRAMENLNRLHKAGALDANQYQRALAKIKREAAAAGNATKAASTKVSLLNTAFGGLKGMIAGLGVGLLAGKMRSLGGSLAGVISDLDDRLNVEAKLGITSERLAGLQVMGTKAGLGINAVNQAMQRMTRRISEAAAGTGEAKDAIEELGLSGEMLNQMGPDRAILAIADAFQNVGSQQDKLRLAFKLFDSEGAQMVNVLNQGSAAIRQAGVEAQQLGYVLSDTQKTGISSAAAAFVDLKVATQGFFIQLASSGAPALQSLAEAATKLVSNWTKFIQEHPGEFTAAIMSMVDNVKTLLELLDRVTTNVRHITEDAKMFTGVGGDGGEDSYLRAGLRALNPVSSLKHSLKGLNKSLNEKLFKDQLGESKKQTKKLGEIASSIKKQLDQPQIELVEVGIS